ncbi:hypothetical protein ABOM_000653 [Aspergillus bombycis]|uniref:Xylanolytic transcriptional activator regulatory domain-containing protein n=1 Tax=Aspergillus bombycis TaxID=109264 RepID=A0A1F8AHP0_9EURO|nr:hypothetical protein ABOM_000653 [Aspergillus bombycis]OGM50818.1 hypothetical protein ABOM_000653 [Aspergillus bombycis]
MPQQLPKSDISPKMRTTLACQWCRKRDTLSHPPAAAARTYRVSKPVIGEASASRRTEKRDDDLPDRQSQTASSTPNAVADANGSCERQSNTAPQQLNTILLPENALTNVDRELVIPTFFEYGVPDRIPGIKLCAIVALCARYIPELVDQYGSLYLVSEHFANVVRENIMTYTAQHPGIDAAHAMILLSLYDWGEGNGFQAWIYAGMATRMANGIYSQMRGNIKDTSYTNSTDQETTIRTAWACFVLDCILRCGRYGPQCADIEVLDIPLPMTEDDFDFGPESTITPYFLAQLGPDRSLSTMGSDRKVEGPQQILSLIIEGFGIFSTLSTWICRGGRRYPSPESIEPPWEPTSFWNRSMTTVEAWRGTHSSRLVYSRAAGQIQAHMLHSQVEGFALLNLLYYMSLLFLHREYIPFFPHRVSRPCGPIDPPFVEQTPPDGWWHRSSQELFEAASTIIELMQDIELRGVQFQTPFTAFCMFSAASAVLYADTWPYMAPGFEGAKEKYTWSLGWLKAASEKWRIVKRWYEILGELTGIFTRLKTDGHDFPHLGREEFQDLHDNMHRLAEPESTTVSALAALSQGAPGAPCQPHETTNRGRDSGPESLVTRGTVRPQELHNSTSGQGQADFLVLDHEAPRMDNDTGIDTDFLMAMLSDPSGDWSHVI